MRVCLGAFTALILLAGIAGLVPGEEPRPAQSLAKATQQPRQKDVVQYLVRCRVVDEKGHVLTSPTLLICDGRTGDLLLGGVVGVEAPVRSVNDGTRNVEYIPYGTRMVLIVAEQPDGMVFLDCSLEISQVKGDGKSVPLVLDSQKKRVIQRMKLGEKLVLPFGKASVDAKAPRMEITVTPAASPGG